MTRLDQGNSLREALDLLDELERARIAYRLDHVRDGLMIEVSVPGEKWEIEIFPDGEMEIERFVSTGDVEGKEALQRLWVHGSDG